MAYVDQYTRWDVRPKNRLNRVSLFPHKAGRVRRITLSEPRHRMAAAEAVAGHAANCNRDIAQEKREILKALHEDKLLPDTKAKLTYQIIAFLLVVFFPLGLGLYAYCRMFGPDLKLAFALFCMWWLNFSLVMFALP